MPKVGKKKFAYTKKGMSDAKKYAKEKGMDVSMGKKKVKVGAKSAKKSMKSKAMKSGMKSKGRTRNY